MHIARHSFGHIAGDKIPDKIPVQALQKLYRFSSVTTTMQYQSSFINSETDKALERVINLAP